ncbi:MAG: hypothetical protein WD824_19270 [Cyclobacteriaceae bacterium]
MKIAPGNSAVTPLDFTDYPFSHSLLLVLGWAVFFGVVYFIITVCGLGLVGGQEVRH